LSPAIHERFMAKGATRPQPARARRSKEEVDMSQMAHQPKYGARDQLVFAVVLIVVGIAGLAARVLEPSADFGGWIVAIIGLGLLGAFAYTRQYGYLIPGGIMTGLGLGIVAQQSLTFATDEGGGGAVVLGLGLGFVSIWAIGMLVHLAQHHWWPLIPGGILTTVGTALLIGGGAVDLLDYWGIALVAIGLVIVLRAFTQRRTDA
jgi:hypothetical protein